MDRKLPELKAEAKRLGLKRYNRLKKADLINLSLEILLLSLMKKSQKLILKFSNQQSTLNQESMRMKRSEKRKSENLRKCLD